MIAIYPGSFDPIHYGHIDIARRSAQLFDKMIWAVYDRPLKNLLFSTEERLAFMRQAAKDIPNIQVMSYGGLTVNFAREQGARVMVRGLRVPFDFEIEYQTALANRSQAGDIETVLMITSLEHSFLSSSTIKELAFAGGRITEMVPSYVESAIHKRLTQLGDDRGDKIKQVSLQE